MASEDGGPTSDPTMPTRPGPDAPSSAPAGAEPDARLEPGHTIARRYRIVAFLGKGGMGEVYRADDLTLGQPVALKFLPSALAADPARLERFRREVRLARQVSHPNVCRVYDIVEAADAGRPRVFLSMEYIDGEDLSVTLRRFGRVAPDKALELARQVCAGLHAAHEQGIIHRDLKPANIMIDGRGRALITDFGIAAAAESIEGHEAAAGTPAYMAPEQLAGREVTRRTDVYSLGLVLYELFTGRKPFDADSIAELRRLHESDTTPTSLTSHVAELDPRVERVILRCLRRDPGERPPSAIGVAAALPGGDPLAAALAAGETPSPELVAASGERGAIRVWLGALLVAVVLLSIAGRAILNDRYSQVAQMPHDKSPEVLVDRAKDIIRELGYEPPTVDGASYFHADYGTVAYVRSIADPDLRREFLERGRPSVISFWRRQSAQPLFLPTIDGAIKVNEPEPVAGDIQIQLSHTGDLTWFSAMPGRWDAPDPPTRPDDLRPILRLTGYDPDRMTPTEPVLAPRGLPFDERLAYRIEPRHASEVPSTIQLSFFQGRLVSLVVLHDWDIPDDPGAANRPAPPGASDPGDLASGLLQLFIVVASLALAATNLVRRRADVRGAAILGAVTLGVDAAYWALTAHHVASLAMEGALFHAGLGGSLYVALRAFTLYLALEPFIRRFLPRSITAWSRLLEGRLNDPLIGRDVLIGIAFAGLMCICATVYRLLPGWLDESHWSVLWFDRHATLGLRLGFAEMLEDLAESITWALSLLFLFTITFLATRRLIATVVIWTALGVTITLIDRLTGSIPPMLSVPYSIYEVGLAALLIARFGLLSLIVALTWSSYFSEYPISTDVNAWHSASGNLVVVLTLGVLAWAFHNATRRPAPRARPD